MSEAHNLPGGLLVPEAWPGPRPAAIELVETHVSWVLRGDREVFKVKKPVDLGFLDFRSIERRRDACEAEVRLNARLAPGVYRGVVPVAARPDGSIAIDGAGDVIDWAVRMRRLDDARRADVMLARADLSREHIDAAAEAIARFHAGARASSTAASRWASRPAVERNVRENFDQTRALAGDGSAAFREVEEAQLGFLQEHSDLFQSRIDRERIVDGHGDLRLEHLYFEDDGLRVIDCIEFDERYRVEDACADVAFLSMDLAAHGRVDLAERFLARYARAADDYDLYALVDFYEGYRAWVRAKIASIALHEAEARRHFQLALACGYNRPLLAPTLVCVGGFIASGKSTIAEALADELSCPIVDADRTRKHLLGVTETTKLRDPSWRGAYSPDVTRRVYAETLRRAEVVSASGRSVVIDASFRSREERARAREEARRRGVAFRMVECRAPAAACRERLVARERARPGPSDGRIAVFDDFAARFEPMLELDPSEHVVIDTTRPIDESLAEVRAHVATWPRGLVA